ncbi:MAG TPA: UDP-N-acetylmuramoyl-L-alanyl-D-glutamate--2,6-diaminopimelate ligase [Flavobacterium sp.]|nr:UDP-N-acetylmuramoyl-L-alanyl-D-glutamate--2,6-diaminopimelate ligase [Flavobacterium sp.]
MKQVKDILYKVSIEAVKGSTFAEVTDLILDSRNAKSGSLFVALKGVQADGHQYINKAIEQGASVVICEKMPADIVEGITYIEVNNSHEALALIADNFYDHPSAKLKLIGVTGTNGKTTTATLSHQLFTQLGYNVGLISTVKILIGKKEFAATHTTPDAVTINRYLHQMVEDGCEFCFMEVSSHGIEQKRTEGLTFAGGIFTNLSHDHLDYHKTFAAYRDVKKQFFDQLPKGAFALTNADDKNGMFMLQNTSARKKTYALSNIADYQVKILERQLGGMLLTINQKEIWVKLIGTFNASNVLAIYATAIELGMDENEVLLQLSTLESVSGRFEYIVSPNQLTVIVDYAHTPDALENVLKTIDEIRTRNEQVITVVGCGGDRDKTKRPVMGKIATEMSDQVIFTSDNPRFEDPYQILSEIEAGVEAQHTRKMITIEDRRQAIKAAIKMANQNDIILIAGKGHETYQDIRGEKQHFSDMEIAKEIIELLGK